MSLLLMLYKLCRSYLFPMWQYILYLLNTNNIEYFIVARRDEMCIMLRMFDELEYELNDSEESFILIRYNMYTSASSNVYYKIIRDANITISNLVSMHDFDSLQVSTCSFIDCQTTNEDGSYHIPMREFSLVSNELFFELFNEWLWIYYLNDDYLPNTVTTLIDQDVNILSLKDTYIKLEKNKYVVMDDNWSKEEDNYVMTECQDKKND